jgi:hypothetical protein
MIVGGARRSLDEAEDCGDAFAWWRDESVWTICLVDGLGHGSQAAMAAQAVLAEAETHRDLPSDAMLASIDREVRWSRGAAIALLRLDGAARTLSYSGVGNVRAALFGAATRRFDGKPGILGAGHRSQKPEVASWRDGDLLLLWTDGFPALLTLDPAGLRLGGDPGALALRLLEGSATGRDDAAVVCVLLEGETP